MTTANADQQATSVEEQEIRELLERVPVLQDKMIVDLVNGIEVAQDHIRVRESRSDGLVDRAWDTLTGTSARRQRAIDQNMAEALQTTAVWLENLQAAQIRSNRALAYVSNKLADTRFGVTKLIHKHLELKQAVEQLHEQMHDLEQRFSRRSNELEEAIRSLDLRQSAYIQMEEEFDKWIGGAYKQHAPLTQMLLVLEALNWGPFGQYDAQNPAFREQLYYKCTNVLSSRFGIEERLLPTAEWLLPVTQEKSYYKPYLAYLLQSDAEAGAGKRTVSGMIGKVLAFEPEKWNGGSITNALRSDGEQLPYVFTSRRLSERLLRESLARMEGGGFCVAGF